MAESQGNPGDPARGPADADSRQNALPWSRRRPARWLLAALTFVIGLFAGAIVVGLAGGGSSAPTVATTTVTVTPTPGTSRSPTLGSGGVTGQVTVNAACLRVLNESRLTYTAISGLVSALQSLDVAKIDQVIGELEPLQSQLRTDLRTCKIVTQLPGAVPTTSLSTP